MRREKATQLNRYILLGRGEEKLFPLLDDSVSIEPDGAVALYRCQRNGIGVCRTESGERLMVVLEIIVVLAIVGGAIYLAARTLGGSASKESGGCSSCGCSPGSACSSEAKPADEADQPPKTNEA
jgi:hypothetical protein